MFRFTIRELLLLTVIVSLGTGWTLEHMRFAAQQKELSAAKEWIQSRRDAIEELKRDLQPYGLTIQDGLHAGPRLGTRPLADDY